MPLEDTFREERYRPVLPVVEIDSLGKLTIRVPGSGGAFTLYPGEYKGKLVLGAAGFLELDVTAVNHPWMQTIRIYTHTGEIVTS